MIDKLLISCKFIGVTAKSLISGKFIGVTAKSLIHIRRVLTDYNQQLNYLTSEMGLASPRISRSLSLFCR